MTLTGADTKPGTENWDLPVTANVSELVDEAFGRSRVGLGAESGDWTEAETGNDIGSCIGTEDGL